MKEVNPQRHASHCRICQSQQRREIEQEFLGWRSPAEIAKEYRLGSRQAIFRHARALGLYEHRARNVRAMIVAVVEQGITARMKVSAAIVIAAAVALSRLDTSGRTIERLETLDRNTSFLDDPRWTQGQMEDFAREGTLPDSYRKDRDTTLCEAKRSELPN